MLLISLMVVVVGAQCLIDVANRADAAVVDPIAYVVNEFSAPNSFGGFVAPVDLVTGQEKAPILLGINPYDIALSPDRTSAWVTVRGDNTVVPIPLATNVPGSPIPVGTAPEGIATTTVNGVPFAYVANSGNVSDPGSVSVINLSTKKEITKVTPSSPGPANPFDLVVSKDGAAVWVMYNNGWVSRIATATNAVTNVVDVDTGVTTTSGTFVAPNLQGLALSPDGSTLWVVDESDATVYSVKTLTASASTSYTVPGGGVALAATSSFLYVVETFNGAVVPINLTTGTVEPWLYLNGTGAIGSNDFAMRPNAISISAGQTTAYVMDQQNQIIPIALSGPSGTGGTVQKPLATTLLNGPNAMVAGSDVDPEAAASTMTASPATVAAGGAVTSTVTVTLSNGAGPLVGHSVAVTTNNGATALVAQHGTNISDSNGKVEFLTSDTAAENVTYTAKDATTGVTLATTTSVTFVQSGSTATATLTSSADPALVGVPVTYSVSVTGTGPTPTGKVTFVQDGNSISGCILIDLSQGHSCTVTYTSTAGSPHMITANYTGDTNYALATSNTITETVGLASTSVNLSSSENPATVGDTVRYTASVTTANTSGLNGTLTFYDTPSGGSTTTLCSGVSLSNPACDRIYQTADVAGSPHAISATYTGDAAHQQSGSNTVLETIQLPLTGDQYVALGDSYSAGVGDGDYGFGSENNQCFRSAHSYAPLLDADRSLGSMAFVACSGAVTDDLYRPNHEGNKEPAQMCGAPHATACPAGVDQRLGTATRVVTLTIGGNDAGFTVVLKKCVDGLKRVGPVNIVFLPQKCLTDKKLKSDVDTRIAALAGTGSARTLAENPGDPTYPIHSLPQILADIHAAAPNAHVFVGVYPGLFGNFSGRCEIGSLGVLGKIPLTAVMSSVNAQAINALGRQMDGAIVNAVQSVGSWATPANIKPDKTTYFDGHGYCDSGAVWFNPLTTDVNIHAKAENTDPGSFHPNADGQQYGFEAAFEQYIP